MCGHAGFVGQGNLNDLKKLVKKIEHRGPDDLGYYHDLNENLFIGHSRLSIIDLNDGKQPMISQDNNIIIVFNGEIYNHLELRKTLIAKGHIFKTDHSDTEVLIHGYREWKDKLLNKLNGMFSFVIYDKKNKDLFLAVDKLSKKPLFYSFDGKNFVFGSELNVLVNYPYLKKNIDNLSLVKYFAYGYFPQSRTLFKQIFKLHGGQYLYFNLRSKKIKIDQYYKYSINEDFSYLSKPEDLIIEEFEDVLSRSIKRRLISDRPLGLFLSGGIDSTLIAFFLKKMNVNNIDSYSINFNDKNFDESKYSNFVSKKLGIKHYYKTLDFNESIKSLDRIFKLIDEPFIDASLIPTYNLCNFATRSIKVSLSGDGADELFSGYPTFKALKYGEFSHKYIPMYLLKALKNNLNILNASERYFSFEYKLKTFIKGIIHNKHLWNPVWLSPLEVSEVNDLFEKNYDIDEIYSEVYEFDKFNQGKSLLSKTNEFYVNFYLQSNILPKADRASMMNGLEVRSPFLDDEMLKFSEKLPQSFKFRKTGKYLLKKTLEKNFPKSFIYRNKQGFAPPMTKWLKSINFENYIPGINEKKLNDYKFKHVNGVKDYRLFLWGAYLMSNYLDREKANINI